MIIRNKAEFFRLWEAGVLGNRTQIWHDPYLAWSWGFETSISRHLGPDFPRIGFRQIGISGGGKWEKVSYQKVFKTAEQWTKEGRKFIMDDGAPDEHRTLQGEICRTYRGLEGYLDRISKIPMRPAMAAGHMRHCSGSVVHALLDCYMDPNSRDDLFALLDLFPDATIEFSCFSVDVGIFPNRNTLFWETRDY